MFFRAILVGLEITRAKDWSGVLVETDSQFAKDLSSSPRDENHPYMALLEDIKALLDSTGCTLQHTLREGNA